VPAQEDAVAARRLGQALDLFLESDDLVPGLAQGADQPVVLPRGVGKALLRIGQALLERADCPGAVRELAPEDSDLLLEVADLGRELLDLLGP
jgi:streptomycin 6-kinase